MTDLEKKLLFSIKKKIKYYDIKINLKLLLKQASGRFVKTKYNTGNEEIVDTGIERALCKISCPYFLIKYAFIDFPSVGSIPFNLYYFQKEILKDCVNYKKIVFNKVRQCGISTLFSLYSFWRANFYEAEYIDVVSIRQLKSQQFVAKIKSTRKNLPAFLTTPTEKNNFEEIVFSNGSKITSESQSANAGRSDSLSLLILDEAAHYSSEKMIRGIVSAAAPTLSRTNGQMIIISTPNKSNGPGAYFYEQVNELQIEEANQENKKEKLIVIDYWEVPDEDFIEGGYEKGYNKELQKYIDLDYYRNPFIKEKANEFFIPIAESHWQNNDWLKKQHDDLGDIIYKQEILHDFVISGSSVFSEVALKRLRNNIKIPKSTTIFGEYSLEGLWFWENVKPGKDYLIGVDIATGTGDDYSSMQVFDKNLNQCAEYKGKISTKLFSYFLKNLAIYYNNAYMIIETNSVGEAVFNDVYYHDENPYENMYVQKKSKAGVTRFTGWITDTKTRKLIINELIDYLSDETLFRNINIYSKRVYMEALSFIWAGNKAVHEVGAHDDTLIALALVLYMRNKVNISNNIDSFYDGKLDKMIEYKTDFSVDYNKEEENKKYQETFGMNKETYDWLISTPVGNNL